MADFINFLGGESIFLTIDARSVYRDGKITKRIGHAINFVYTVPIRFFAQAVWMNHVLRRSNTLLTSYALRLNGILPWFILTIS